METPNSRVSNSIEHRVRIRAKRGALKTGILQVIALGGLVTLAVAAPNLPKAIPKSVLKMIFDRPQTARNAAVARLIREGYLVRESRNGRMVPSITPKGEAYISFIKNRTIPKPRSWDGKWRIVIFDIREKQRTIRDLLRREIEHAGFVRLQDSVWVYPFPCEEFVALLKADARIGKDVLYVVAEEIENDRRFREHFGL